MGHATFSLRRLSTLILLVFVLLTGHGPLTASAEGGELAGGCQQEGDDGVVGPSGAAFKGPDCRLVVGFAHFNAVSAARHVRLTWRTASEVNNLGFNIYRGTHTQAPSAPLNRGYITAQSSNSNGFSYSWSDYDVVEGTSYYYWLEDVDASGPRTLHGPVVVLYESPTAVMVGAMEARPTESGAAWPLLALVGLLGAAGVPWLHRARR